MKRREFIKMIASAAAVCPLAVRAETYPSRPITMIVPFAAGGPTDILGRLIGQYLGQALGQSVIVEDITGAGGTIGATRAAKAQFVPTTQRVNAEPWL